MELTVYRVSCSRYHRLWWAGRCRSEAEQGAYQSTGHTHSCHSYDSDAKGEQREIVRREKEGERGERECLPWRPPWIGGIQTYTCSTSLQGSSLGPFSWKQPTPTQSRGYDTPRVEAQKRSRSPPWSQTAVQTPPSTHQSSPVPCPQPSPPIIIQVCQFVMYCIAGNIGGNLIWQLSLKSLLQEYWQI